MNYLFTQFSTIKFGTLSNSFTLFVTIGTFKLNACAAISISKDPIGVPFFQDVLVCLVLFHS